MFISEDKSIIRAIILNQNDYISSYFKKKKKISSRGNIYFKYRKIIAPNPVYKNLQAKIAYWFNTNKVFRISNASWAWVKGRSREECARQHIAKNYILEVDITDYFGSVKEYHLEGLMVYNEKISELLNILEIDLSEFISFLTVPDDAGKRCLPQGFVTSTILANAVRYYIDIELIKMCIRRPKKRRWTYSNYGDNLYISGSRVPKNTINSVIRILNKYGFEANHKKSKVMPYFQRQNVLGIVVNEKLSIKREYVKKIINEIHSSNEVNPKLIGMAGQLDLSDNKRNFKYINKLIKGKFHDEKSSLQQRRRMSVLQE